jgi:hypothetical protein
LLYHSGGRGTGGPDFFGDQLCPFIGAFFYPDKVSSRKDSVRKKLIVKGKRSKKGIIFFL